MKHIAPLDGMRAIAATGVLVCHAGGASNLAGGYLGVDMFFVLSGYLITEILASEHARDGRIATARFYLRRVLRLMPALALLIAVYVMVAPLVWPEATRADHSRDALITGLYLSDYAYAFWGMPYYLRHSWSLAAEEHFYLLWPLVLPLILRSRDPARVLFALYLVAAAWRGANFVAMDWHEVYFRFDTRVAGILLGGWLALALRQRPGALAISLGRDAPTFALAAVIGLFIVVRWESLPGALIAMPAMEWLTVLLIVAILQQHENPANRAIRLLGSRPMVFVGTLSYGIYLWHMPISMLTKTALPWGLSVAVCFAGSIAMAWISWHTVEHLGRLAKSRMAGPRALAA